MRKYAFPIIAFSVIISLPVFILMAMQWKWSPDSDFYGLKILLWITETAGSPWSFLTSVLLIIGTLLLLGSQNISVVKFILVFILCILVGQGIKSVMKTSIKEPRPYVMWLKQEYGINPNDFYALKRADRSKLIDMVITESPNIPDWQLTHWKVETGYAFPSGHTFFAVNWALLLIGLLWQRRYYITSIILALWAESIIVSRLLLGMHWPSDIIASIILSAILSIVACKKLADWSPHSTKRGYQ